MYRHKNINDQAFETGAVPSVGSVISLVRVNIQFRFTMLAKTEKGSYK